MSRKPVQIASERNQNIPDDTKENNPLVSLLTEKLMITVRKHIKKLRSSSLI